MAILYVLVLLGLLIYSYSLVDPNLTLINYSGWAKFREQLVYLGYYHRQSSWLIYLLLVFLLFIFHFFFKKKYQQFSPIKIGLAVGLILLFSYPFLSHDFFNYLFDARIFTFYGKNPYLFKAADFPQDLWLRFMHWTHRTYPYGPVFLVISFIPSILSLGKFFLSFFLFKLMFFVFYFWAVYCLTKLNKKWGITFATHPLMIIEGLVNSHNDLIGVALAIVGIYFLFKKRNLLARILFLFSGGIKYITFPLMLIRRNNKLINRVILVSLGLILLFLSLFSEIQPWYFLAILIFIPYFEKLINNLFVFFFGLVISYFPYIRYGGWDEIWKVSFKHQIIIVFLVFNLLYLAAVFKKKFKMILNKMKLRF